MPVRSAPAAGLATRRDRSVFFFIGIILGALFVTVVSNVVIGWLHRRRR